MLEKLHLLVWMLATVIRTLWYWQRERHGDQWNNIKYRNRPMVIRPVAFLTKLQSNSMKKEYSFNIFCWICWHLLKCQNPSQPYTLYKSWLKIDAISTVNCMTIKLLKENRRKSLWPRTRQRVFRYDTESTICF